MFESRADLHVHSKYSDRPSEWLLRRIGAPECFVEPIDLYRRAKANGMDFVTISDHNCIDGALEIAHLDDVFISNEVTTYFPEDKCKIHFLVTGISEEQHREIDALRTNIYELRDYVLAENIVHSVAHPFFRVNRKLSPAHVEKLLLLFNRFEGLNGSRDARASQLVNIVFRNLTQEWIERAASLHGIEPVGERPWHKVFTGGSDDHSGLYVGSAYTVTSRAETVNQYLQLLRDGRHDLGGRAGTSLRLARSFYEIGYQYYKRRFGETSNKGPDLIGEIFEGLRGTFRKRTPTVGERFRGVIGKATARRRFSETELQLVTDLSILVREIETNGKTGVSSPADWQTFERASRLAHLVGYRFVARLSENVREGRLLDALQNFAALAPVGLGIAPYLASFATQHKDESFLQRVAAHFPWSSGHQFKSGGRCWMTDTYQDVNGVAKMIQLLAREAHSAGYPLEVITCEKGGSRCSWQRNFEPIGDFSVPEYEMQKVAFPPFLDIMEYIESRGFSEIVISTPGPVGVVGLLAAKLLGLRAVGIYHTDFPAYVRKYTENEGLVNLTWTYLSWFYEQMDLIYAPSQAYCDQLEDAGFLPERLAILKRGVETSRFSPAKRSESFYRRFSGSKTASRTTRLLYVGRVSEEKNLGLLLDEFESVPDDLGAELYIVGDGPDRDALQERAGRGVFFTGFLDGEALAVAYASADVFVFPSETDTFGNVVLEAQASGLPAVVSTKGGPPELVEPDGTGVVVDCSEPGALRVVLERLCRDEPTRRRMGLRAREHAAQYTWESVLESLWHDSPTAHAAEPLGPWRTATFDPEPRVAASAS